MEPVRFMMDNHVQKEESGRGTLKGMCTCCAPRWGSHHSPQWDSVADTLRLMLARAKSVSIFHFSEYVTGALDLDLHNRNMLGRQN